MKAVENLQASEVSANTVQLQWDSVEIENFKKFVIEFENYFYTTTGTEFCFEDLEPSTEYTFSVNYETTDGQVSQSNVITVGTADIQYPPPVPFIDIYESGTDYITISWESVDCLAGVREYEIFCDGDLVVTTGRTRYTVDDLESDCSYRFGVRVIDNNGIESEMTEETFRTDDYYDEDYSDNNSCCDSIHNYGFKPNPVFYGEGKWLSGVELEVDKGTERKCCTADGVLGRLPYVYCKEDGSLNSGFEIVTHPATLEYHKSQKWQDTFEHLVNSGFRSHNTTTCGLHVHVNRNFFGDTSDAQDLGIMKVLYFIEKFWDNLVKISRRKEEQLRWANRYGLNSNETPNELLNKAKRDGARYRVINIGNRNTIEFRIFRGTLKHSTFIATLEFVHAVTHYCNDSTPDDLMVGSWADFTNYVEMNNYATLVAYLREKELF